MEEKKLTDEEIIEELIQESNRGEWCELSFIDCVEVRVLKNAIDLIHRLQSENAEYKRKLDDGELVSKDWHDEQVGHSELVIDEQKTEIEELKEMCSKSSYKDSWKNKFFKAQEEIERLTEENAILKENPPIIAGRSLGKTIRAKLLAFDKMKEQAVKDTAKEILDELLDIEVKDEDYKMFFLDVCEKLEKFAQKYGVEVE